MSVLQSTSEETIHSFFRSAQVLCSKCRSICNENSENVGRKRKHEDQSHTDQPTRRSDRRCSSQQQQQQPQQNTRSQRLLNVGDQSDESSSSKTTSSSQSDQAPSTKFSPTLIPKISRLRPTEIGSAIQNAGKLSSPLLSIRKKQIITCLFYRRSVIDMSIKLNEPFYRCFHRTFVIFATLKKLFDTTLFYAGSVKPCIQLAEQVRSVYWNGRNEEDLAEEEELENRPMNVLSSTRPEPMELDSNPTQAYCATPRRLSSSSVESAKIPPDEEDKKTLAAADSTVEGASAFISA